MSRPTLLDPNQFYYVWEAAAARAQSTAELYRDAKAGDLKIVSDGTGDKVIGAEIIRANRKQAGLPELPQ